MNILLIGNGFDLAHGLPTKYTDFLIFCKMILKATEMSKVDKSIFKNKEKCERWINDSTRLLLDGCGNECEYAYDILYNSEDEMFKTDKDKEKYHIMLENCLNNNFLDSILIKEVSYLVYDNFWVDYFKDNPIYKKENWIDFESEISQVIQSFDKDLHNSYQSLDEKLIINKSVNRDIFSIKLLKDTYSKYNSVQSYKQVRDDLLYDLNRLIRAFEIYLTEYVEKIDVKVISPDIKKLDVDYVLSFNYTHTFSKKYRVSEKGAETQERSFDYIHGEANTDNTIDSNNMVLGIDEYLSKDRKDKNIEFIGFKKYFQRIYKGTGCKYKKWLDIIERDPYNRISNENHNLYIFGHSLDDTDGDILRDLILNDYIYTRIFYYNKSVLSQQIANLVKVIGQDELIERTGGGSARTIEFIKQQDMESVK